MKEIKDAYAVFIASKLTLEDYFKISILCATRYDVDKFNIKPAELKYDRVIMVFRDHPKNKDDYFLGQDFSKLHSKSPIEIKIESLMSMLGKSPLGDVPFENVCTVFKLKNTKDSHGRKVIRGHKHYSVPGGDGDIKVGVWEWNLDAPNTIFWLPSENLIENLYRCDKTPSCGYTTKRLQVNFNQVVGDIHQHLSPPSFTNICHQHIKLRTWMHTKELVLTSRKSLPKSNHMEVTVIQFLS